jgi:hypothetical protein
MAGPFRDVLETRQSEGPSARTGGTLDVWSYPILVAVGLVAGFANVMAGGGSLITMPALIFLQNAPGRGPVDVVSFRNQFQRLRRKLENAVVEDLRHRGPDVGRGLEVDAGEDTEKRA